MIANDITIRIGGEAGMGLESTGVGFGKALTRGGLYVFGLPDYYSRIRVGHNFFSVRAATESLYSQTEPVHILLALDLETIRRHVNDVAEGGAVVYDESEELPEELRRRGVTFCPVALTALAKDLGGREVMRNTVPLFGSELRRADVHTAVHLHRIGRHDLAVQHLRQQDADFRLSGGGGADKSQQALSHLATG